MDKGTHFYRCDFQVHTPRDTRWVGGDAISDAERQEYAKEFILENRAGAPTLLSERRNLANHQIEVVGEKLRAMMPWIKKNKLVDQVKN